MDDEIFLRRAIELAATHSADGVHGPFGSVVTRDGEVVGEGWNQVVAAHDPTAHAEVVAIRDAARNLGTHALKGCVLYTSCEPCPLCLAAAYWAGIDRVVYAASSEDAGAAGFADDLLYGEMAKDWEGRRVSGLQLLRDEGQAVLEAWVATRKKIPY